MNLDLDPPRNHHRGEYRPSTQRRIILAALAQNPAFVTAQALHAQLISNGRTVGLSTVYRTLHIYATRGDIDTTRSDNGTELFRYRPEPGHHHYLRCRACGYSIPIHSDTVEAWTATVGPRHDFTDTTHTVEVLGICRTCRYTADDDVDPSAHLPPHDPRSAETDQPQQDVNSGNDF
jgi:Fur family transcriptional regulator, ferric uptake regulator